MHSPHTVDPVLRLSLSVLFCLTVSGLQPTRAGSDWIRHQWMLLTAQTQETTRRHDAGIITHTATDIQCYTVTPYLHICQTLCEKVIAT